MKRVLICLIGLLMAWPALADVNEGFEGFVGASYGTYDYNGFHIVNGLADATYPCAGAKAVRLRDSASPDPANQPYLEYIGLDGNGKDGGVGTFSFWYRAWDGTPAMVYDVTYSIDGGPYQSAGQINSNTIICTQFSYDINSASDNIKIRVQRVSGERMHIDDFYIQDFGGGPAGESDAHVAEGGVGAQATISSLVDTEGEAQVVMTFDVRDDGTGSEGWNTVIEGVSIVAGSANSLSNWTQVIAGAKLTDGVNTWTGTITSGAITFTGAPLTTLPDGGAWQTWSLSIWLTTSLPFNADNEILEFKVGPSNFTTDPNYASFDETDAPVESGDTNNKIDIVATQLSITTQPPATASVSWTFTVRAGFTDENGGIDEDFPSENITLSVASGIGNLSSATGLTKASASGQSAWTDLLYDVADDDVVLQAVSATYPGPAYTNAFDVASITVDAMPLCWDGNATDQAAPFVVHVSIRNWEAAAETDCYLKVYDGGANPFHYTEGSGWSSSTAWAAKPLITLDANGDWSGWLALKSKALYKFRPRVALAASTSIYITGFEVQGTLLDLVTAGVIVEDRNGSSLGDPGNVVLARNGVGDILGAWIIEDNGYPLDDGGSAIAEGGWRLAMCDVCEDVTFESWAPATWPNGYDIPSFFDIVENFCPTPGTTVEMDDVILPVNLLSFTAAAGDGEVTLNWKTASELDNAHFVILRDNAEAARVTSRGDATTGHEYSWTDDALTNGTTYSYTLIAVSLNGDREALGTVEATPTENAAATITEYALRQNYPNPFNPSTQIGFDLVESGIVTLKVYNLMGQTVATVVNGTMSAGSHMISFDATNLTSGVYLYRIEVNGFAAEKKMLLMK